ncbi:putative transporter [Thozetella sp. PMI_491]|nr:putative transporter [Thozetella sp. PMI_491]
MDFFRELTGPMLAVCVYASLGGMSFGIDYNYWSGLLGMDKFKKDFGVYSPESDSYILPASWQSAGSGAPIAGLACGALISGFVGNAIGRVKTFQFSSVISVIGIIIQSSAMTSYWQIVVGRVINSLALGVLANTVPAYQAECAPSKVRGTLINCYQFSLGVGAVLVNTANWGMNTRDDQWAYRMVIVLQLIVPAVLLTGSFFVPESPRWLVGKGRSAEALEVLEFLRKGTPRDLVEHEVQLLSAAEEENRSHFSNSWFECFKGTNLRRTLIATGVQCLQQAQGTSFMSSYAVVFMQTIGIEDTYKIIVLLVFTMAMSSAFAFYFPDRLGRRWIMIGSSVVMAVCMFTVAGITGYGLADDPNAMKAALAMLFIWWFTIAIGWSSCVWIVTAEVPTLQLREKTIMTATFFGFCVSVLVTFINPFMQDAGYGNLGGRVGFIYGSFSVVAAVWCLFFLPETGSRSLEELDELFEARVSVWNFSKYQTSGFGAQIAVVEGAAVDGVAAKNIDLNRADADSTKEKV